MCLSFVVLFTHWLMQLSSCLFSLLLQTWVQLGSSLCLRLYNCVYMIDDDDDVIYIGQGYKYALQD